MKISCRGIGLRYGMEAHGDDSVRGGAGRGSVSAVGCGVVVAGTKQLGWKLTRVIGDHVCGIDAAKNKCICTVHTVLAVMQVTSVVHMHSRHPVYRL